MDTDSSLLYFLLCTGNEVYLLIVHLEEVDVEFSRNKSHTVKVNTKLRNKLFDDQQLTGLGEMQNKLTQPSTICVLSAQSNFKLLSAAALNVFTFLVMNYPL